MNKQKLDNNIPRCFDFDATIIQTRIIHQIVCFNVDRIAFICNDDNGVNILLNDNASKRNILVIQPAKNEQIKLN